MRAARLGTSALLALVVLLVSALVSAPAGATTTEVMMSVGDSVPSGARCGCTAYSVQYAALVAKGTGRPTRMANYAYGGATSVSVLRQVRSWSAAGTMAASSLVVVMVGANDFSRPFERVLHHRERAVHAYRPAAALVRTDVTAIVRRLRQLHPGIRVVVLGYWNVVKDGAVGRRTYGAWGMRKADQATGYANIALYAAAKATGATYVSTLHALKGPDGTADPTRYLAADGDHPNAAGHAAIAQAVYRAVPQG